MECLGGAVGAVLDHVGEGRGVAVGEVVDESLHSEIGSAGGVRWSCDGEWATGEGGTEAHEEGVRQGTRLLRVHVRLRLLSRDGACEPLGVHNAVDVLQGVQTVLRLVEAAKPLDGVSEERHRDVLLVGGEEEGSQ